MEEGIRIKIKSPIKVMQKLAEFQRSKLYCDLELHCDDGFVLDAHRIIVAAHSKHLQEQIKTNSIVYVKNCDKNTVETLVEYMYEGVVDTSEETSGKFLELAKELGIECELDQKEVTKPAESEQLILNDIGETEERATFVETLNDSIDNGQLQQENGNDSNRKSEGSPRPDCTTSIEYNDQNTEDTESISEQSVSPVLGAISTSTLKRRDANEIRDGNPLECSLSPVIGNTSSASKQSHKADEKNKQEEQNSSSEFGCSSSLHASKSDKKPQKSPPKRLKIIVINPVKLQKEGKLSPTKSKSDLDPRQLTSSGKEADSTIPVSSASDEDTDKDKIEKLFNAATPEQRMRYCLVCEEFLDSIQELQTHIKTHNRLDSFKCKYCLRTFSSQPIRNYHQKICSQCDD